MLHSHTPCACVVCVGRKVGIGGGGVVGAVVGVKIGRGCGSECVVGWIKLCPPNPSQDFATTN